ncbi:efflux RND transporter periplasmic adaptor subunit [Salinisphaera sp. SPP-AMP-43]|uniref:efflux RND transporter periplasmic adaptor subunit n=1 Tax=Salinisphaera sp. SPP-AMP-43 TaxID=3121288 RepID=UPI003C6DE3FB
MSLAYRPGLLAIVAMVLLLAGCSESETTPERAPASVSVYQVSSQPYTVTETLPGRTRAYMTSDVRPQVDGIIQKRLFTEGAHVAAGDALYRIDASRYQAAVAQAKAQLQQAQAAVKSAEPLARRYQHLADIDAISKQDRDNAVADLAQDRADVANAKANLQTAQINLGYTQIKAPISGRIGASAVTPGALVTANQSDALTTINQLDPIYVDIQQSVSQYLTLKHAVATGELDTDSDNAAPVTVTPEGGHATLTGKLEFSSVTVESDTGTVMLRAIVPNPEHTLLPGMYVRARLTQGIDVKSILVPQQAVQRDASGEPTALLVDTDDKVTRHKLKIASATDDNRWRVTSGLSVGDRVIVEGTDKVSVGDRVDAVAVTLDANGDVREVKHRHTQPADQTTAS